VGCDSVGGANHAASCFALSDIICSNFVLTSLLDVEFVGFSQVVPVPHLHDTHAGGLILLVSKLLANRLPRILQLVQATEQLFLNSETLSKMEIQANCILSNREREK
jgi:hypothetical protein